MESVEVIENELNRSANIEEVAQENERNFKIVNQVGILYSIVMLIIYFVEKIFVKIFIKYFSDLIKKYHRNIDLIFMLLVDILRFLLMFILTRFIKKTNLRRKIYGCKKYFINLCINTGLNLIGIFFGLPIHYLILAIISKNSSEKSFQSPKPQKVKNPNIFLELFVYCIEGPFFEELIFRKFLIDRLALNSKSLAIFASGIMFGIFHRNFYQFFMAMLIGWALAYSYMETNNLLIPISYHIYWNSLSFLPKLINPIDDSQILRIKILAVLALLIFIKGIIGIIFLVRYRNKIKVSGEENNVNYKSKFCKSYGMWIFIFEGIISTSLKYYYSN